MDINGTPPPPELQGYNDVVLVPAGMGNVRFIAQFNDFANDTIPFMYHCHMLTHEDMGMMGQFIVSDPNSGLENQFLSQFNVYPNPSNGDVTVEFNHVGEHEVLIQDVQGRLITTLNSSLDKVMLDLFDVDNGVYVITVKVNGSRSTKRIIKR